MTGGNKEILPGIIVRGPETGDEAGALEFFNNLVSEDAMILMNEPMTLEGEARWLADRILKVSEGKSAFYFAVEKSSGKIVGSVQADSGRGRSKHVATIGLSISAVWRGKGLGKRLLALILKEAKVSLGAKIATLSVFEENDRARTLYSKAGFLEEGMRAGHLLYRGKYSNEILMSKKL